jgi:hypothetical protein
VSGLKLLSKALEVTVQEVVYLMLMFKELLTPMKYNQFLMMSNKSDVYIKNKRKIL